MILLTREICCFHFSLSMISFPFMQIKEGKSFYLKSFFSFPLFYLHRFSPDSLLPIEWVSEGEKIFFLFACLLRVYKVKNLKWWTFPWGIFLLQVKEDIIFYSNKKEKTEENHFHEIKWSNALHDCKHIRKRFVLE